MNRKGMKVPGSTIMRNQMLSGLRWTAGARFGAQFVTWGITLIVMRLLSPRDYGLLATASVFIALLLMMAEAGLWPALVQRHELDRAELRQAFGIVIAINVCFVLLLNCLAPTIAQFFHDERLIAVVRALSLQFVFIALTVIPGTQLQRELKFRELSLINLTASISSSILTLVLADLHYGVWSLVLGTLFSGLLKACALNALTSVHVSPRFSLSGMRRLLHFGGTVTGSRLLWFFFTQADVVIIGRILGQELLGFYSVAMHLASLPVQRVGSVLNQVTFPVISRFQADREGVANFVIRTIRILSLLAFPVLWGISSIANELVDVALGPRWHDAIMPLRLLALIMPLRMLVNFLPSATDALGYPELGFQNALWASLLMPVAFAVGSEWGIIGVASAWVLVYPAVVLLNTRRMLSAIGLRVRDVAVVVFPSAISAAVMYLIVWGMGQWVGDRAAQVTKLAIMIVVGILAYGFLSLTSNRQACRDALKLLRGT